MDFYTQAQAALAEPGQVLYLAAAACIRLTHQVTLVAGGEPAGLVHALSPHLRQCPVAQAAAGLLS
jgi:hypothetical protein